MDTKYIVNLSGGKDSTAMLLMLLEKGCPVDYILFADTGKDFPQMQEHLRKLAEYIKEHHPTAPEITTEPRAGKTRRARRARRIDRKPEGRVPRQQQRRKRDPQRQLPLGHRRNQYAAA